jgi:dsDNA-binding SOS-regulon protein
MTLKTYYRVTSNFGADVTFSTQAEADKYAQVLRMRSELQKAYVRPFVAAGEVETSELDSVMSYLMDDYLGGEE